MKGIKMPLFRTHRLRNWVIIFFIATACIIFLGAAIFSHYAEQQIEQRLKAADCVAGAVNFSIFSQQISIASLELNPGPDSVKPVSVEAEIKKIILKNVSLYNLIINKKIKIGEVLVADGNVRIIENKAPSNHRPAVNESDIKNIFISRVTLKNIKTTITSDTLTRCSAILNVTLHDVRSSGTKGIDDLKAYSIRDMEANISNLVFNASDGFYETRIASVHVASNEEKLAVDSLTLTPKYPKYKFSRVAGKQIDRVNAFVSRVEITGLQYDQLRDSTFIASKIDIKSAEVYSFRDKRMSFKETKNKPLPVAAIKNFDFGIEVDTVQIKDAKITYEEFPQDGFESGKVTFEDLQATLVNVSDQVYQNKPPYSTLDATAKIMGEGLIQASFSLPLDQRKSYHAKGKISQMALYHLNPALEKLAFIKVESGRLNDLYFNFDYNDISSKGTVTINYQDLKITGLKKEKSQDESDIKTFLINTIVKNDKDKNMPTEKRTGAIEFERDRKRQIFNFWWKSLLSGIKSSVLNADKDSGKSNKSRK